MKKQRPRRVGFGMQPRQGVEVQEIVKESPTAAEVSGVEVQPEVPVEAVLEGVDV